MRHLSLLTANHGLYVSAQNRARSVLQITKNSFINRKCPNLAFFNSSRAFWHLAKNISHNFTSSFPHFFCPDENTAVTSVLN